MAWIVTQILLRGDAWVKQWCNNAFAKFRRDLRCTTIWVWALLWSWRCQQDILVLYLIKYGKVANCWRWNNKSLWILPSTCKRCSQTSSYWLEYGKLTRIWLSSVDLPTGGVKNKGLRIRKHQVGNVQIWEPESYGNVLRNCRCMAVLTVPSFLWIISGNSHTLWCINLIRTARLCRGFQ